MEFYTTTIKLVVHFEMRHFMYIFPERKFDIECRHMILNYIASPEAEQELILLISCFIR